MPDLIPIFNIEPDPITHMYKIHWVSVVENSLVQILQRKSITRFAELTNQIMTPELESQVRTIITNVLEEMAVRKELVMNPFTRRWEHISKNHLIGIPFQKELV